MGGAPRYSLCLRLSRLRDLGKYSKRNTRNFTFRRVVFVGGGIRYALDRQNPKPNSETTKGKVRMKLDTLKTLYIDELRDLYNAENQLLKALPKMAKGASSEDLKDAFEKHLEQTKSHVERLEEVFQEIGETPKGKTCKAMKVEHYEIASYGSVRTFAQLLGKDRSAELLQTTLDEESETNETLNQLAEEIVNPEALMEPELAGASSDR